jgi:hypothetical protein
MISRRALAAVVVAVGILACDNDPIGPASDSFEWSGQIAPGDRLEIKGIIGSVLASRALGGVARVTATKEGRDDPPATVRIEVVSHADGVTICAMYPDVPGQPPNQCLPGLEGNLSNHGNNVEVTFTVTVPAGVEFVGRTITGDVLGTDLQSDALISTITGDARVTTSGVAEATSITGSVVAEIGSPDWGRDLTFSTVTGGVDVEIPSGSNAEVRASVVTGAITSDFPLTQTSPGQMRGTIGNGGPRLTLSTVTGSVRLRRGF